MNNEPCDCENHLIEYESDIDICSGCREHTSFEKCEKCDEQMGSVCCGASEYHLD